VDNKADWSRAYLISLILALVLLPPVTFLTHEAVDLLLQEKAGGMSDFPRLTSLYMDLGINKIVLTGYIAGMLVVVFWPLRRIRAVTIITCSILAVTVLFLLTGIYSVLLALSERIQSP